MTNGAPAVVMLGTIPRGPMMGGKGMPYPHAASHDIAHALQAWQETADKFWLEHLIRDTRPRLESAARGVLRRLQISDWSAVDDALALVFDHLRRLPFVSAGERSVARFDTSRTVGERSGDPGLAYLVWLAHERALDVARQRRRQATRCRLFAATHRATLFDHTDFELSADADEPECDAAARLHAALSKLEPRLCTVVELLLDGKSQAMIAHVLGVCDGTVSRMRSKAIAELKRLMTE